MANLQGTPIWYELLTNDAAASTAFYGEVIGWKVQPARPGDERGYRMIDTATSHVGGMMQLSEQMRSNGAKPTWLFYIGVDDVDATAQTVEAAGGTILMKAFDIPNIGRLAMIADPQGIPLYIMRGASNEESTVFNRHEMGKCNWNELATPNQVAANAFYATVFGWKYPDKLEMRGAGDYVFVAVGDTTVGATMTQAPGAPSGWQFYFRTPDIAAAAERVKGAGGKVHAGPMDVPGGDRVILASDGHGLPFGVVARGPEAS